MSSNQAGSSLTAALAPAASSTKRLSTIHGKSASAGPKDSPGKSKAAAGSAGSTGSVTVKDVVSPGELCGFVDTLLAQLETRFDEMSEQVLGRMNDMSTRIDNLETTIQDLMTGGIEGDSMASPSPSASKRP